LRLPNLLRKLGATAAKPRAWAVDAMARRLGQPEVVFLGDSITQFWLDADPSLFWPRRINLGVSGSTSTDMLDRFERDVAALAPKVLHVMGGTNDLWYGAPGPGASTTLANLMLIAEQGRTQGMRVILAAPPPVAPGAEHLFAFPELLPVLRAELLQYCRSAGVIHIDYAQSLLDDAGMLRPSFTTDGVHLTKAGYRAMRAQSERILQMALRAPSGT
jgi:lysophospholipase L1-like esterase